MKKEDRDLAQFFNDARNKDLENLTIPSFESMVRPEKPKSKGYLFLAIAAIIIAVIAAILLRESGVENNPAAEQEIVLFAGSSSNTKDLIESYDMSDMDTWESPTHSLIEDF